MLFSNSESNPNHYSVLPGAMQESFALRQDWIALGTASLQDIVGCRKLTVLLEEVSRHLDGVGSSSVPAG
jgi:hypothetical protein